MASLLEVEHLSVELPLAHGAARVVDDVSFALAAGKTVALVGESGSGKSMTALALLRLSPQGARLSGSVRFDGRNLLELDERACCAARGGQLAMIFQEPMTSLNPVLPIGEQVAEPLRLHRGVAAREARQTAIEALRRVGIPDAERRARDYPHQLSGGMRQRVMIAMALIAGPALLIADEPTTALDVTIQAQILALLAESQRSRGMGMLLITHDLGVVAEVADEALVMYAGRIVERAPTTRLFANPIHPYTQLLLKCSLAGCAAGVREPLPVIPGESPTLERRPAGCAFHPRCPLAGDDPRCRTERQTLAEFTPQHFAACWKARSSANS